MANVTIEKHWDGNEGTREGRNGRIYTSHGRWQWLVIVEGKFDSDHNRRKDAKRRADEVSQ